LHVYNNSAGATFRLQGTRTADGEVGVINFSNITDITGGYIIGSIAVNRSGFDNGGAMIFSTATAASTPTERLRITSGGKLGIGVTDPNALVTLRNSATDTRLELDTESAGSSVLSFDRTASAYKVLYLRGSDIQLNPNDSTAVIVKSGGNVGIGTNSPQEKFVVSNGGSQNIEINPSFIQSFNRSSPGYAELPFYSSKFSFNVGNLLVGTTSDNGYKLHVNGSGNGLYVIGANVSPFTQTIATFVYGGNSNSINIENQGGKASIQARDSSSSAMTLHINPAGGKVLIGTSTDGASVLRIVGLPTSATGLSAGDIWNDGGTLKIV
jgi:hypothetical protein